MKGSLIMALLVLLTVVAVLAGCESSGGDGNGGGSTGSNAGNQAACDNYCNLCESDHLEDCMEDCLGDEDAPNLTQECLECTANATECGEIDNKCWEFCRGSGNQNTICNNHCQLCDNSDGIPNVTPSSLERCVENCHEYITGSYNLQECQECPVNDNSQECQECMANTQECGGGKYEYLCGEICH